MAGRFTTSAGQTTVDFIYVAVTAKVQNIVDAASHYLWNVGFGNQGTVDKPILFETLTNQQKLDIVDGYVRKIIMDAAKSYSINAAADSARTTASKDAEDNLTL
jgi:hypothetical protein